MIFLPVATATDKTASPEQKIYTMGIGLKVITSNEASKWVPDSAFQVLSEGTLKAVGRPVFTMVEKSANLDARKFF